MFIGWWQVLSSSHCWWQLPDVGRDGNLCFYDSERSTAGLSDQRPSDLVKFCAEALKDPEKLRCFKAYQKSIYVYIFHFSHYFMIYIWLSASYLIDIMYPKKCVNKIHSSVGPLVALVYYLE